MSEITKLKTIYFVRHGETRANVEQIVQPLEEPLNATGLVQADRIAARAATLSFTKLITSDQLRAVETATAIAAATGIPYETSPLFRETTNPSALLGQPYTMPEVIAYHQACRDNAESPDWRYGDEESFHDVTARIESVFAYLETLTDESVMIVTHGKFLRSLVAYTVLGDTLTPRQAARFGVRVRMSNTGITIINRPNGFWQLLTWNDHAHFAE